ncbi:MAG TPA: hypothetical protein DD618_03400 [Acholeplasmatales bacterium]|nr:hypothetical protein [Acholeplasmatales bacterium]
MSKTFCKVLALLLIPLFIIFLSACNYHYSRLVFDSKGGSVVDPITQEYGTAVVSPADPTKYGHDFSGWYLDDEFTQPFVFENMAASNVTLYAKWSLNRTGVVFDSNWGSDVETLVDDFGTVISKPSVPERPGYTFVDWFSDEALSNPYVFSTMPGETITLHAK